MTQTKTVLDCFAGSGGRTQAVRTQGVARLTRYRALMIALIAAEVAGAALFLRWLFS